LEKPVAVDSYFFGVCRNLLQILALGRNLSSLSLYYCYLSKEAVLAIGEGLQKNNKLQALNLRGNQINISHLTEFITACAENKRLVLQSVDLSVNNICDEAGVRLAKCFKNLKTLNSINLKNNSLEWESSDAFLFLVKENHSI
jgi:Ran GTPase-activating protein (RanGAP) involved in mRNA processing and transport